MSIDLGRDETAEIRALFAAVAGSLPFLIDESSATSIKKRRAPRGSLPKREPKPRPKRREGATPWRQLPHRKVHSSIGAVVYRCLKDGDRGRRLHRRLYLTLGYTIAELRNHIESQFADGMSWDNYGAWELDHKRPLASFKVMGPECHQLRAAWALRNLQPLWKEDNRRKGAKLKGAANEKC